MPKMIDNVLVWASDVEDSTIDQAAKAAALPFVQGHVALMPDAHIGIGATIGSVIPTKGAIVPAAVGVDIGCGMIAVDTGLTSHQLPDDLTGVHDEVRKRVPAGVGKGHLNVNQKALTKHAPKHLPATELTEKQNATTREQFGTLGSGNHFVEVCLDERDAVWVVLHSGSRGIGNQLARIHIDGAKGLMARYFIDLPDPDLAYFVEGTPEFDAYIEDMLWAQQYALGNREAMMDAVLAGLAKRLGLAEIPEVERVNCHHNFTERENHHGHNVWLTRNTPSTKSSTTRGSPDPRRRHDRRLHDLAHLRRLRRRHGAQGRLVLRQPVLLRLRLRHQRRRCTRRRELNGYDLP